MAELIQKIRARLEEIRGNIKSKRQDIVEEAVEMLAAGFDEELVFEELRDRYVDSVPLFAEKLDASVDFEKVIPGIAGQILEAVDGLLIDRLLKLFIAAAGRRVNLDGPTIGDMRRQMAGVQRRRVEIVRRPIASSVADVPSRPSALEVSSGGAGWGMDEEI
jgi:hypothetical protein